MTILRRKVFTDTREQHRRHLSTLRTVEACAPAMGELFQRISDAEWGLTLIECTRTDERIKMNETKIRLDMMRLEGHILLHEGRYYNSQHVTIEDPS